MKHISVHKDGFDAVFTSQWYTHKDALADITKNDTDFVKPPMEKVATGKIADRVIEAGGLLTLLQGKEDIGRLKNSIFQAKIYLVVLYFIE